MLKCPNCGYENSDDALKCNLCNAIFPRKAKERPMIPCSVHPDVPADGICTACAKHFCRNCLMNYQGQSFCRGCYSLRGLGGAARSGGKINRFLAELTDFLDERDLLIKDWKYFAGLCGAAFVFRLLRQIVMDLENGLFIGPAISETLRGLKSVFWFISTIYQAVLLSLFLGLVIAGIHLLARKLDGEGHLNETFSLGAAAVTIGLLGYGLYYCTAGAIIFQFSGEPSVKSHVLKILRPILLLISGSVAGCLMIKGIPLLKLPALAVSHRFDSHKTLISVLVPLLAGWLILTILTLS